MPIDQRDEMRCPTCGARPGWADTCRRCKCDLRLLRAAERAYEQHRAECLRLLIAGFRRSRLCAMRRVASDCSRRRIEPAAGPLPAPSGRLAKPSKRAMSRPERRAGS